MAIQLMRLRYVPPDELAEICALLDAHAIDWYETSAGTFGISLPALWLRDAEQLATAKALLDDYAQSRLARAREEQANLKSAGRSRTYADIIRENPLRFVFCMLLVGALVYFSIAPFLNTAR